MLCPQSLNVEVFWEKRREWGKGERDRRMLLQKEGGRNGVAERGWVQEPDPGDGRP